MPSISIQLPAMEADQKIEIEVKVNGKRRKYNYRVEIFPWAQCTRLKNRAECLREMIENYDQQWQIVQIGGPTEDHVPVMFKQLTN